MDSDQGFLFLIRGEPLPTLEKLSENLLERGFKNTPSATDENSLFLERNDCILSFQRVGDDENGDFIGGAILPYFSKRKAIGNLLLLGLPFLFISFGSILLWVGSYVAAVLHVLGILSMPVDSIDFLLQWMPIATLGFAVLFLIPASPSLIVPFAYRKNANSIQSDLTNVIGGFCESLDVAEFKRHNIWQDIRIPKHVTESLERAVNSMPSPEYQNLIQSLGRP
jgi:hypothetical protein